MLCGWEGNCRSGVSLAMRHTLQWFIHLRAHGLRKGHGSTPLTLVTAHFTLLQSCFRPERKCILVNEVAGAAVPVQPLTFTVRQFWRHLGSTYLLDQFQNLIICSSVHYMHTSIPQISWTFARKFLTNKPTNIYSVNGQAEAEAIRTTMHSGDGVCWCKHEYK